MKNVKTGRELAIEGLCELCEKPVPHGPWSEAQIAEAVEDLGTTNEEFFDWCDDCFVSDVAAGDAVWAQKLLKRPLQVTDPAYIAQLAIDK